MRHVAHRTGRRGQGEAEQALLLGHVEQFVFDPVAAAFRQAAADQHEVLLEHAPGRVGDFAAGGRAFRHRRLADGAELAGTGQVGTDDVVDVGVAGSAAERHHRDRQGRGVAADDIDFQPLGLRERAQRGQRAQQQGEAGRQSAAKSAHGQSGSLRKMNRVADQGVRRMNASGP